MSSLATPRPDYMPQRVLIADDNPVFRATLRRLLEGADSWEIIEANDGQEAVTKAVEARPDAILIDLAMPFKDGFTAAREISQLLPDIPIFMCTMHRSPYLDTEAKRSGIRKVFSKSESSLMLPALRQLLSPGPQLVQQAVPETIPPPVVEANAINSTPPPSSATPPAAPADPAPAPILPKNVA